MLMTTRLTATALALCLTLGPALAGTTDPLPSQSPINIITSQAQHADLPALQFDYADSPVTLGIVDTGSPDKETTVRADVPLGSTLTIGNVVYDLLQFHLHAASEHTFNSMPGAMELHLVHQAQNADGTRNLDGALAVVGQIISVGAFNKALAPYFNALEQAFRVANDDDPTNNSVSVTGFDLTNLMPSNTRSYRYSGSLTAPNASNPEEPFFEPVEWNVLAAPIEVSQEQLDAFARLFPKGNAREVQDLNGRTVTTDVSAIPLPATGILFVVALGGLAALRRRAA